MLDNTLDENCISNNVDNNDTLDKKDLIMLTDVDDNIVKAIIDAKDREALQRQFEAFNIAQNKKNALRVIKLNDLLDKIENQAIDRFEKRPDQISNKELLEYMQVVSNQIDRSQKYMDNLETKSMINIKNNKNELNVNIGTELDKDGKEHVIDAIKNLLSQIKNPSFEHIDGTTFEETLDDQTVSDLSLDISDKGDNIG